MVQSFEEYETMQRRARAVEEMHKRKEQELSKQQQQQQQTKRDGVEVESSLFNTRRRQVGAFVELYEVQLFVLIVSYLGLCTCAFEFVLKSPTTPDYLSYHETYLLPSSVSVFELCLAAFNFIWFFVVFVFTIEILLLIVGFGIGRLIVHLGYTADLLVVCLCILFHERREMMFLTFLRVWRIARLISLSVLVEHEDHLGTKKLLENEKKLNQHSELNKLMLEQKLKMEATDRQFLNKKLLAYKDEIETLKEALEIAAMDVAAATGEQVLKEMEASKLVDDGDEFYDDRQDESLFLEPNQNEKTTIVIEEHGGKYRIEKEIVNETNVSLDEM